MAVFMPVQLAKPPMFKPYMQKWAVCDIAVSTVMNSLRGTSKLVATTPLPLYEGSAPYMITET